jgi:prepilin-type N-terminal cleavage/methylation domain-containing protein
MNTKINKLRKSSKKVNGFTLIELIVVIAIISVLALLAIMNMVRWIGQSRVKNANSDSKLLFNSVQTIVQDYNTRSEGNESTNTDFRNDRNLYDQMFIVYDGDNFTEFTIYDGNGGNSVDLNSISGTSSTKAQAYMRNFLRDLGRYYHDASNRGWSAYIQDGIVVGVVYSEKNTWRYHGIYPYQWSYDQLSSGVGTLTPADMRYDTITPAQILEMRNAYIDRNNGRTGRTEALFDTTKLPGSGTP